MVFGVVVAVFGVEILSREYRKKKVRSSKLVLAIIGVTAGIFRRPSCKSKPPKRENLCYFASGEEARAAGFRPCKHCRSDLLEYQPMREIAAEIKARLDKASSLDDVGLTPRRMTDVFKQEYGVTPKEYADSLRLRTAKEMLAGSPEKVIDAAYQAGFSSLAAFNRFFKQQTGQTPTAYRKEHQVL